eukprot:TRINITY_DN4379_c0_g1_i1.p1 TRINITY_DN4379_c0_g1~~TRINITY_DN4379_c0_g1_i1.p1  ORF type:complete len:171 (-),score=28.21 TRINITY_DN4379_c0_g1_i1:150-662(-)
MKQEQKHQKHKESFGLEIFEVKDSSRKLFCNINKMVDLIEGKPKGTWKTPSISLSLPSFSGRTPYQPQLLKYSCRMDCSIRMVKPAKVMAPTLSDKHHVMSTCKHGNDCRDAASSNTQKLILSVVLSKPLAALMFDNMKIYVKAPSLVTSTQGPANHQELASPGPISSRI